MTSRLLTWRMKFSPKKSLLLKERICSDGANYFLYEVTPIYMGGNNENDRVASPESVSIHLKVYGYTAMVFLPF